MTPELINTIERVSASLRESHIIVVGMEARQVFDTLLTDGKQLFDPQGVPIQWVYDITEAKLIYGSLK
jgi:hypothetical protein